MLRKFLSLVTMLFTTLSGSSIAQELPPAAIYIGVPQHYFKLSEFIEIGTALEISCKGEHRAHYKTYRYRDQKCYKWHAFQYDQAVGRTESPRFCFTTKQTDENFFTQVSYLLFQKESFIGLSHFPRLITDGTALSEQEKRMAKKIGIEDTDTKMTKMIEVKFIDCETRKSLAND